jgi:acetyl-CoA carboxylase carboxyltransferase component
MSWKKELEEKLIREKLSENLGGKERVKKQHDAGRYTIRERINILTDKSSFHEIGKISGSATYDENNDLVNFSGSNFIFGNAKIDGRNIVVGGDDFTLRGGSADASIRENI